LKSGRIEQELLALRYKRTGTAGTQAEKKRNCWHSGRIEQELLALR
jgi:hypothetical protein